MRKIIFTLLLLVACPVQAEVNQDLVDQQARELFDNTMSPYCPGRTLSACPSGDARNLRDEIAASLAAGQTPEQVRRGLEGRFGDAVRGNPDPSGFGGLALLVPGLFVLLGAVMIYNFVKRQGGEDNDA